MPRSTLPIAATVLIAGALAVVVPRMAKTAPQAPAPVPTASIAAEPVPHSDWCADNVESLPSDVCYLDGRGPEGRRTLVIWLHGVIGKTTHWSRDHQKMLSRVAKETGIEIIFPKGILEGSVFGWPGTADSQAKDEEALIEQWMNAKAILEKRENKPFDETFIFGFSSGAYFASSLALRGRVDVDGYAVLAGGQPMPPSPVPVAHFAPVFVGVCTEDETTAAHSRAYASSLAAAGIPRMVDEQPVSHDVSEKHFVDALAFLRRSKVRG